MTGADPVGRFRDRWSGGERFVLTTHINPDGDAIGSEVSLAAFLVAQGKSVRIINQDPTPEILAYLRVEGVRFEVYDAEQHDPVLEAADTILLVDNSAPDRLGTMEPVMRRLASSTLCIDHHPMRNAPWSDTILDTDACATTAMIHDLIVACGWQPDAVAADAIYVGLVTDTGFFRFNSTNARGHEIAAGLLRAGVDSAGTFRRIYERNPVAYAHLLGHALTELQLEANGQIAYVGITWDRVRRLGAQEVDPTEITTSLLAIDGVRMAILFRELADGKIKVSLRSKGTLDVHGLAIGFGGGGHRNASGIVAPGKLSDVMAEVTARAAELVGATTEDPCA